MIGIDNRGKKDYDIRLSERSDTIKPARLVFEQNGESRTVMTRSRVLGTGRKLAGVDVPNRVR